MFRPRLQQERPCNPLAGFQIESVTYVYFQDNAGVIRIDNKNLLMLKNYKA